MELLSKHIKNDRQAEWVSECRLEGVREQAVWERGRGDIGTVKGRQGGGAGGSWTDTQAERIATRTNQMHFVNANSHNKSTAR